MWYNQWGQVNALRSGAEATNPDNLVLDAGGGNVVAGDRLRKGRLSAHKMSKTGGCKE